MFINSRWMPGISVRWMPADLSAWNIEWELGFFYIKNLKEKRRKGEKIL